METVETVEQQPATGGTVPVEDKQTVTEGNGGGEGEGNGGEEKGGREGDEGETQGTYEDCSSEDHAGDDVNQGVMTGVGSSNGGQNKDPKGTRTRVVTSGPPPPTPDLPYTEPHWSGPPSQRYSLTVIKSGSLLEEIDLSNKPFLVHVYTDVHSEWCTYVTGSNPTQNKYFLFPQFIYDVPSTMYRNRFV